MSRWTEARRDERGAVAVIVAVAALVMFAFAALVVDLGQARDIRRQSQNASDASALAAANAVYASGTRTPDIAAAVAAVKTYAQENLGIAPTAWNTCRDPGKLPVSSGSTECVTFARNARGKLYEVRVRMPDVTVATPFGALLGVRSVPVSSIAQAIINVEIKPKCGLCVLGSGMLHDLQNGDVTVQGADIHFNGHVNVQANGLVATDGSITVEGSATGPYSNYEPDPTTGQAAITDPLATVPMPTDFSALPVYTDPCTQGPGRYGSVNLRNKVCTLLPGLYVIAGSSGTIWDMAGNETTKLLGAGVTLYFTCGTPSAPRACDPNEMGANLDASGNGFLGLTPPADGDLEGFSVIYDRNNSSTLRLTGNGSQDMTGTLYAPSGKLQMNGNGCSDSYDSLIIVKDLELNGNGACLLAKYDWTKNALLPPGAQNLSK